MYIGEYFVNFMRLGEDGGLSIDYLWDRCTRSKRKAMRDALALAQKFTATGRPFVVEVSRIDSFSAEEREPDGWESDFWIEHDRGEIDKALEAQLEEDEDEEEPAAKGRKRK